WCSTCSPTWWRCGSIRACATRPREGAEMAIGKPLDPVLANAEQGTSLWADAWVRLRKNHLALLGLGIILVLAVVSLLSPWIAPYGYEEQNLARGASPPSWQHWMGTDIFGRDLLTRVMWGGRMSLMVG